MNWAWRSLPRTAALERVIEVLNSGMLGLQNTLGTTPVRQAVRTLAADGVLTGADGVVLVNTTAGNVTVTLPEASINRGRRLTVKKTIAANTLTLDTIGSETIDGAATLAWTTRYQSYDVVSDGAGWHVV